MELLQGVQVKGRRLTDARGRRRRRRRTRRLGSIDEMAARTELHATAATRTCASGGLQLALGVLGLLLLGPLAPSLTAPKIPREPDVKLELGPYFFNPSIVR